MTEAQFVASLDQSLTEEQKLAALTKWRAENPQPEVEEEVVAEETSEVSENGEEEVAETEEVEETEDTYIPFSVLAGDTPGLSTKQGGFGTEQFGSNVLQTMEAYNNYYKTEPRFNKVAEIGETHTANGYDYKSEIRGTKLVYYTKKEGEDEWIELDPESDSAIAVAGTLKHIDLDVEAFYTSKQEAKDQKKEQLTKLNDYNNEITSWDEQGFGSLTVKEEDEVYVAGAQETLFEQTAFEQRRDTKTIGNLKTETDGSQVFEYIDIIPEEEDVELSLEDFDGDEVKHRIANRFKDIKSDGWTVSPKKKGKFQDGDAVFSFSWKGDIEHSALPANMQASSLGGGVGDTTKDKTAKDFEDAHVLERPLWLDAGFNSYEDFDNHLKEEAGYKKLKRPITGTEYWSPTLGAGEKYNKLKGKYKKSWTDTRSEYTDNLEKEYKEIKDEARLLEKEWDENAGVTHTGTFTGNDYRKEFKDVANPKYVKYFSDNFLVEGIGNIKEDEPALDTNGEPTGQTKLEVALEKSIGNAISADPVINKKYLELQLAAKPLIQEKQAELAEKYDLTTEEGNAAATEELQQYAKSLTQDKLVESEEFITRVEGIKKAADVSFNSTVKAYGRMRDGFFSKIDAHTALGFENTAAFFEGIAKGSKNIQSGFNKMQVSWEQESMESASKSLKALEDLVEKGEVNDDTVLKVEGKNMTVKEAKEFYKKSKSDAWYALEQQLDDLEEIETDLKLYREADLKDMSLVDAFMTTGEALPQIALATAGTVAAKFTGGTSLALVAPLLTGLGTATMFTQMYGDAYMDALETGVVEDLQKQGIDFHSLSDEEKKEHLKEAFETGKYANQAQAASTALLQTSLERLGAGKILKQTTKALGLGTKGSFSLIQGQWKQGGKQLLRGMLNKGYAGLTEFGTEWSQEILGQLGKGMQLNSYNPWKYSDFEGAWQAGKAGGVVGLMMPSGAAIASQSAIEVRALSRKIAINFAPDSKFGQASMVAEAQFQANQNALDKMLKNGKDADGNVYTEEQHQEDSQALASIQNAYRKIPNNVDADTRGKLIDLMVERDKLERKIEKIDDKDLTETEQSELDAVKDELKAVMKQEALFSKTGNVKAAIIEMGDKAGKTIDIQDFDNAKDMDQYAKDQGLKNYKKKYSSAHGVILIDPKTGNETILINNDVSADATKGNVNVAGHEFLHSVLRKTIEASPETAKILGDGLTDYLNQLDPKNVDPESNYGKRVQAYKDNPEAVTAEEKITLLSDALVNGDIKYNENVLTKIGDFIRRSLQAAGLKDIKFKTGKDVFNFVRDYNASMDKDAKLNKAQEKMMIEGAEVAIADAEVDATTDAVDTIKSIDNRLDTDQITADTNFDSWVEEQVGPTDKDADSSIVDENRNTLKDAFDAIQQGLIDIAERGSRRKGKTKQKRTELESKAAIDYVVAPETEAYLELENDVLQQGLVSSIKNNTDQQFPIAQAIVEKNWGLISPKLDINNEVEMNAAKEIVIDQLLGKVEATQDKKYGPRNTSILEGFSLDPEGGVAGAQVSTYLTKAISTRKPEIDAAIADRTRRTGRDLEQARDKQVVKTKREKPTKKISPKELKDYTTTSLENLGVESKADVDTLLDEAIDEDIDTGDTVAKTFGKTRPGKKLAGLLGKMFGLDPRVFTDKSWGIRQGDIAGLRNLRQFLDKNAQKDFELLPDAYTQDGKSTFVPNNVLNALYKKGKDGKYIKDKSKTLKDYKNLLGDIDGAVYRATEASTIKGLAELSIRNLIVERAASKLEGKAKVELKAGAKFSKPVELNSRQDENLSQTMQSKDINQVKNDLNIKGDVTVNKGNRVERIKSVLKSIITGKIPGPIVKLSGLANFGRSYAYGKIVDGKFKKIPKKNGGIKHFETKEGWVKENSKGYKTAQQDGTFIPARGSLYYGKNDPNYKEAMEAAENNNQFYDSDVIENLNNVKRVRIPKDKKLTEADKKARIKQEKINMKALEDYVSILDNAVNVEKTLPLNDAALLVSSAYQGTNSLIKIAAPFVGVSKIFSRAKTGKQKTFKNPYIEEHSIPASAVGAAIIWGLKNNSTVSVMKGVKANYAQIQLATSSDRKLDLAKLANTLPEGISILTPNAGFVRLAAAGINTNNIVDLTTGKSVAETLGLGLNSIESKNPSAVQYQNELIQAVAKGELKLSDAKKRLEIIKPIAQDKNTSVKWNSKNLAPTILSPDNTTFESKTVMLNSQETAAKAQQVNKPTKGISVFDFDDTLAKTKEKVIVTMPDGKVKEISASEFARTADVLTEAGAEFNFSNFENVAKTTKEGPLADLARKRQGKFGSGDIFILTARPQTAGPAIQSFLRSIGINIPLENITGLEDGSAQAKVDWILNKTAEGYNDFYFADDSKMNVEAVQQVLDQVDVKSDVQQAMFSKPVELDKEFNEMIEETTGLKAEAEYSETRAKLEGRKRDRGLFNWFKRQLTITPSAEDFMGLMYDLLGRGKKGTKHAEWIKEKLMDPYNKAEQMILSAKVTVANDFANLKKQFPSLKSKRGNNPLMDQIGVGPYTKSHAVRVYNWVKQGIDMTQHGMSQRDVNALVKAVESDNELNVFADEVGLIQKDGKYPPPGKNWQAGDIATDITDSLEKDMRRKAMTEFNENADIIFSEKNKRKLRAIFGDKWVSALEDSLRRMKSGSNRPVYVGGGARIVNSMLDWLNGSVGAVMFLNMRSGLLQLISNVNFVNWGDNNILSAAKAFASKDYFPTVMKLLNSDYLVNRRDGLKINVNEAELANAAKEGGIKGMIAYLLDKGFVITRIMDSLAIATGGATFFINRKNSLLKRTNPETGKKYTEAEAEAKAFDDFYAIAEESQQSSNPSKISQQQASLAGRVILSFQNVTMQYNRLTKKAIRDLYNRRKRPGMTQRESDLSNVSKIVYYVGVQNMIFHSLQKTLFASLFDDEEDEKNKNKTAEIANGMVDSLLFGLGFGGAVISTVKNVLMKIGEEHGKKTPKYEEAVWNLFDISPVLDNKVRKMRSGLKTFSWNKEEMRRRGWSLDNPAYIAISQMIAAGTNIPLDRVLRKTMNIRAAMDEETRTWQRVSLLLGWDTWSVGLPYWGLQSTIKKEEEERAKAKIQYKQDIKKLKKMGYKKGKDNGPDVIEVEHFSGVIQYWSK